MKKIISDPKNHILLFRLAYLCLHKDNIPDLESAKNYFLMVQSLCAEYKSLEVIFQLFLCDIIYNIQIFRFQKFKFSLSKFIVFSF